MAEDHFIPRLALGLTLLVAVPFVGLSFGVSTHPTNVDALLSALFTYAAIVLSFLGGIHWGIAVTHAYARNPQAARLMYIESIMTAVIAWAILFLHEPYLRLLAFAFLYAIAWCIDSVLYSNRLIPLWYFNLRGIATPIVVVSMYVAYFSII